MRGIIDTNTINIKNNRETGYELSRQIKKAMHLQVHVASTFIFSYRIARGQNPKSIIQRRSHAKMMMTHNKTTFPSDHLRLIIFTPTVIAVIHPQSDTSTTDEKLMASRLNCSKFDHEEGQQRQKPQINSFIFEGGK